MLSKSFREQYKENGFLFKASKEFSLDKRSNITITEVETGHKVTFRILIAFGEMNIMGFMDEVDFSDRFKYAILKTLDYIAKNNGVKIVSYSFGSICNPNETIEWKEAEGFAEYEKLFKSVTLNGEVPVKLYDNRALFERVNINEKIINALNESQLKGRYKTNNHIAHVQVWWRDEEDNPKEVLIYNQGDFFVKPDRNSPVISFDSLSGLEEYLRNIS